LDISLLILLSFYPEQALKFPKPSSPDKGLVLGIDGRLNFRITASRLRLGILPLCSANPLGVKAVRQFWQVYAFVSHVEEGVQPPYVM
jgi:hypothetical protein